MVVTRSSQQIGAYGFRGFVSRGDDRDLSAARSLADLPTRIGAWLSHRFGSRREAETRRRLVAAGWYSTTPTALLGYRLIAAIVVSFLFLIFGALVGASTVIYVLGIVVASACSAGTSLR